MEAILAGIAIEALKTLIKESPAMYASIRDAINKPGVTPEELSALREKIIADSYQKLVTNSQLPTP